MQKILIADDAADLLDVLSMLLKMHSYNVEIAFDTESFFNKLAHFKPDIILLDTFFGGADGREICRHAKQTNPNTLIILMSAVPGQLADAELCSADGVIEKPFDIEYIIRQIQLLISSTKTYQV